MSAQPSHAVSTLPTHLEEVLARLSEGKRAFARLTLGERRALLARISERYHAILEEAVRAGCALKGLEPTAEEAGEEWFAHGFAVARHLRLLKESLAQLERRGAPPLDLSALRVRPNGALALRAFPETLRDKFLFPGIEAETYFERGMDAERLRRTQASFYRAPPDAREGRAVLILGAGNVASIPARDALTKLFNEGKVVLLKMNPVNSALGPLLESAFAPAIERGFFAVAYGGAELGTHLANHEVIDELHITGSDKTHDLLLWGPPGTEREERKHQGRPLLMKPITSELGNVSPVIALPGPWGAGDLDFQAQNIAGMVTNNASFNCNAARILVTQRGWSGREPLLERIIYALSSAGTRRAWYPGAMERYRRLTANRRQLDEVGCAERGELPWALLPGLDPTEQGEPLFTEESFCPILGESALEAEDPIQFLHKAVCFANEQLWGTLCATLLVHPALLRDARFAAALEEAIEELRYGTVAINLWPAAAFALSTTAWGAHPSGTPENIQSGRGFIGNTLMLEGIEKTVIRAPFRMHPKPIWFPNHRRGRTLGRRVVELERSSGWSRWAKLPGAALAALQG